MINKFIWSDEYNTESEIINEQHRKFFEIANKIVDLVNSGNTNRDVLFNAICQLGDYASYHIGIEEETLLKSNDPSAQSHIEDHKLFREEVKKYVDRARDMTANVNTLAGDVASFVITWLTNHILTIGKKK